MKSHKKLVAMTALGWMIVSPAWAAPARASDGQIQLKAGEMTLLPFLAMASEKLDLQIDASGLGGPVLETVTVPDLGPLTPERAREVLLTVLYHQGYAWIHDTATDLYRVVRQRDARDQELPLITDAKLLPDSDLLVHFVLPLENARPEYIARHLRSFMPANSRIIPNEATRTVLITDSAQNILKLRKLVAQLDTPEAGKKSREWMLAQAKKPDASCPPSGFEAPAPHPWILITLFSLIALVIGFLGRGYVIRRIEGGL
jgi:type II secretory pathway component GspD/PulD (secretin)